MAVKAQRLMSMCWCLLLCIGLATCGERSDSDSLARIRVPAEWEPHAATWMQWPNRWESSMRPAFADIIDVIQDYEPIHLLISSQAEKIEAEQFLTGQGVPDTNITWHIIPVDNAWMRDNGPVYVTSGTDTWILNFRFNRWGRHSGSDILSQNDNAVPDEVADYLGITSEDHQDYVLERGNLEFNGAGMLVLNWDCQDDRNPGMTKAEHETILKNAFGVTKIIWAYGHDPDDGTIGHIDRIARFVDSETIVIADYESEVDFDRLALACQKTGLEVLRYPGDPNWFVGNGFVLAIGEGNAYDDGRRSQLERVFPGRDVYMINASTIAFAGGGIHCVTNDQPVLSY